MGNPIGSSDGNLQCFGVGDAAAVAARNAQSFLRCELTNLQAGPVNDHNADAQTAKKGNIEQQVTEVRIGNHRAVNGNHEDAIAELRNVVKDFAEVGKT